MNVFDQGSRFATSAEPDFVLARAAALGQLDVRFRTWFNGQTVPLPGGPDRIADLTALVDDPAVPERPWLLVLEFQSSHDPDKMRTTLLETAVFHQHARDPQSPGRLLRVLPVLIYLKGECPDRGIDMRTPNGLGLGHFPAVWELEKDSAVETLAGVESGRVSWGAMFWVPLMSGGGTEEVIAGWLRLLDTKVPEGHRNDVAYIALEFAEMAGCRIAWERIREGRNVVESMLYREAVQKGKEIERVRTTREHLLFLVREKFREAVPEEYLKMMAEQESYEMLEAWYRAAVTNVSAEIFLGVLRH